MLMKKVKTKGNLSISLMLFILISVYLFLLTHRYVLTFFKNTHNITFGYSALSSFSSFINLILVDIKQADSDISKVFLNKDKILILVKNSPIEWSYKNNNIYRRVSTSRPDIVLNDVKNFQFDWVLNGAYLKSMIISGNYLKKDFKFKVNLISGLYE